MFAILRRLKNLFNNPVVRKESTELYNSSKLALETHYLNKPVAEATASLATSAAALVASLNGADNSSMRIGVLLVIKTTDITGKVTIVSETLSPELADIFDKNPDLVGDPDITLSALKNLRPPSNGLVHNGIDTS